MLFKRVLYLLAIALFFVACSTKKNTVASRAYHNLTARFNGYYYSCVNIDDGVFRIEKNNKDLQEYLKKITILNNEIENNKKNLAPGGFKLGTSRQRDRRSYHFATTKKSDIFRNHWHG